jgi:predicted outer membrane repeat protein
MNVKKGIDRFAWVIALLVFAPDVAAVERYVPGGYTTIQAAIDASNTGDVIIIAQGTYTGVGNRNINFKGKAIKVRSSDPCDPSVVAGTIINCQGVDNELRRGFSFTSGETWASELSGLTITNGYADGGWPANTGGAIYCGSGSPTITRCRIINNRAEHHGGGIYCSYSSPKISDCNITGNSVDSWCGGGLYFTNSTAEICRCMINANNGVQGAGGIYCNYSAVNVAYSSIVNNSSRWSAGGMDLGFGDHSNIKNCIIANNTSLWGTGGVLIYGGHPILDHCTLTKNVGIADLRAIYCNNQDGCTATVTNCVIWGNDGGAQVKGNMAIRYCDLGKYDNAGTENIQVDPLFVNSAAQDYHLSANSPCINKGDPYYSKSPGETDLDGQERIQNRRTDMGAYERNLELPCVGYLPVNFTFTATQGRSNPSQQTLTISNDGTGAFDWAISPNAEWLQVNPANGHSDGESNDVVLSADITGLAAGTYNCELTISASGALNNPVKIPVSLIVQAPVIALSANHFDFSSYEEGPNPAGQKLTIRNSGVETLNWTISCESTWLHIAPTSGRSSGDINEVSLNVDKSGLTEGTYICELTISSDWATNSPQKATVTLNVFRPIIDNQPDLINFAGVEGVRNPSNQILQIRNSGTGSLAWSVAKDCNWIKLSPSSGVSTGQIDSVTLAADINNVAPGVYNALLTITGQYASNSPKTVPVSLTVPEPYISALPKLQFSANEDSPKPAAQIIAITNGGGGTLNWEIDEDCNWFNVTPSKGTTSSESDVITVSVDVNGLTAGTYDSNMTIVAGGATNTPQKIAISLFIHGDQPVKLYVPTQFPNIQAAVDAACDGDVIEIDKGIYTGTGNRNIDFKGKAVMVTGTAPSDPNIVSGTIIDCQATDANQHGAFYFCSGEDSNSIIKGLTIENGYTYCGGGVICCGSSPQIINCNFIDCSAEEWGGAIVCFDSNAQIVGCKFAGNSAREGGAITVRADFDGTFFPVIRSCEMFNNSALDSGGGINCDVFTTPVISNCIITNNFAGSYGGGGISIFQSNPTITNCTIANNMSDSSGGGILQWYRFREGSKIANCIIWDNQSPGPPQISLSNADMDISYSNIQYGIGLIWDFSGLTWGPGNIEDEPLFADSANRDYHLSSAAGRWDPNSRVWVKDALTSPCVDAGDSNSNWPGELWPHGKQINMGAYGGTAEASMSLSNAGSAANLNNDSLDIIDYADFAIFCDKWLTEEKLVAADLNRDGAVNLVDFAVFGRHWLEGK